MTRSISRTVARQSFDHFTVGGPVEDLRLTTLPAYGAEGGGQRVQSDIRLSDSAIVALKEGAQEAGNDRLRIAVSEWFEYDLHLDRRAEGDIEVLVEGVVMLLDLESVTRAAGMSIDFGDTEPGSVFRIQNPNQPPKVKQLGAAELKAMMDRATSFELIDVRTEQERAIARVAGSRLLDERTHDYLLGLDRDDYGPASRASLRSRTRSSAASTPAGHPGPGNRWGFW